MYPSDCIHGTGCGVTTLDSVSSQSPKETLIQFLKVNPLSNSVYVAAEKAYVTKSNMQQIHVIFGGPDMSTLSPTKGHFSAVGSCGAFADFIREHSLGVITQSPPRHNPYHSERKEGEGDVIVYIWSPDHPALIEWAKANPPLNMGAPVIK